MTSISLSEEDAQFVKRLEEAACEYGAVLDLLSALEILHDSGVVASEEQRLFDLAAMAAGLARVERKNRGIDKADA